ncbi:MAG: TonB-dependent siderophore receptor [Rhizobiales bacterium]|nr:TonB-dependent siderophore receptor [Hyphomicrobiales bacterium]
MMNPVKKKLYWAICCGTVSYLALSLLYSTKDVYAEESVPLPAVTVDPPKRQPARRARPQRAAKKKARAPARRVAAPVTPPAAVPYVTPSTGALGAPPPPYAGGQVATGGRLGMLGNRSVMDTPFSQTSYTAKLIQDQQARTVGDVLMNNPSVRVVSGASAGFGQDIYHIRGFFYGNNDIGLNNLYGLAPYYSTAPNFAERVEVISGPSALLNGMPPAGAIGGSINLITKQAPDFPITQLTTTYASKSHIGAEIDFARRFGDHKEFGVRFNGGYRNGNTNIDRQTDEFGNAVLNLDYRGERVRLSADIGYQSDDLSSPLRFVTIAPGTFVPPPPKAGSNYGGVPWSYWRPTDKFAMVQGEVDITDNITAYAAYGWHNSHIDFKYPSPIVTNAGGVGNWVSRPIKGPSTFETWAGQVGVRAVADTGPVNHALNVNYSKIDRTSNEFFHQAATPIAGPLTGFVFSNLYNPNLNIPVPTFALTSNPVGDTNLSSVGMADTMSILNNRVQLTVGARHQTAGSSSVNAVNGAILSPSTEASVWSPAYAILVKPLDNVSVYANYIEGLQAGRTVSNQFVNAGEVFPPTQTKQTEAGVKVDFGRITTTVAAFEITRPSFVTVGVAPNNLRQVLDGEQRNRGVEINVFGEITPAVRLLGGVAFIDGRLTKTAGGANDGHKAQGVADVNVNLGAEWDTPFIPGLTLAGRVIYTSGVYVNAANTQSIPDWTRLDLGARYTFASPWNGKPITVRFAVENVANKSYWAGSYTSDGVLTVGAPRTYLASTTFNF